MGRWVLVLGLLVSVSGCSGTGALLLTATPTLPPAPSGTPTATLRPLSSPTLPPTATLTPLPTSNVRLPFQPSSPPPPDAGWMVYRGRFESKAGTAAYRFMYPATWFLYPNPDMGSAVLQNVSASPGGGLQVGMAKIEVNFVPCAGPGCFSDGSRMTLTFAGRQALASVAYDENFNVTMQELLVPVEGGAVQFAILVGGRVEQVPPELRATLESWLASVQVD